MTGGRKKGSGHDPSLGHCFKQIIRRPESVHTLLNGHSWVKHIFKFSWHTQLVTSHHPTFCRKKKRIHQVYCGCAQNKWKNWLCRESQHFLPRMNHFKSPYDIYSMHDGELFPIAMAYFFRLICREIIFMMCILQGLFLLFQFVIGWLVRALSGPSDL